MAKVFQNLTQGYHYVFDDLADSRVKNWWLMESPGPVITIIGTYLFFCTYAGPRYMKDKKPYQLKHIIRVYNVVQIAMSGFLVYLTVEYLIDSKYNFRCPNIDFSNSQQGIKEARSVWWYFVFKITELLETVFFVLRKKNNQLSFLHLYHHSVMTSTSWFATKYSGGGQSIVDGGLNSFIHILMYIYYFVASLGSEYQKYLWWKKYLTTLQLIQFTIIISLNTACLYTTTCNYPLFVNLYVLINCVVFLFLFVNFYRSNFVKGKKDN